MPEGAAGTEGTEASHLRFQRGTPPRLSRCCQSTQARQQPVSKDLWMGEPCQQGTAKQSLSADPHLQPHNLLSAPSLLHQASLLGTSVPVAPPPATSPAFPPGDFVPGTLPFQVVPICWLSPGVCITAPQGNIGPGQQHAALPPLYLGLPEPSKQSITLCLLTE